MTIPILTVLGVLALGAIAWLCGGLAVFMLGFGGGIKRAWPLIAVVIACGLGIAQLTVGLPSISVEWR